ncbi:VanZ family protein [Xylanivirga thermophila]|uniref:VanZ family protein n=1 Tax=Xylanivirga thermophila TaxID=2496273 RepID=UPI00101D80AF|nr:VanZ family protein [Xylanivirga thermophila]
MFDYFSFILMTSIYLIISCIRVLNIRKKGKCINFKRELLRCMFFIYLFAVISVTIFPLTIVITEDTSNEIKRRAYVNFIPFNFIRDYANIRSAKLFIKNVVGNIILFIPFGLFLPAIWEKCRNFPTCLLLGASTSICIEFLQWLLAICNLNMARVTDIDDVILNTTGVVCGFFLYKFIMHINKEGDFLDERL